MNATDPLDQLVVLVTLILTVSGLLAFWTRRLSLGFALCVLAIAVFWGYYLGGKL